MKGGHVQKLNKYQRFWWWEEYHCGCVTEYAFKNEMFGYCSIHGEKAINVYKMPLEAGSEDAE